MGKWKERILYELTKEPQKRKLSMQDLAKRLLIGFFVMMLLLTAVSRAADTVTVAKVVTGEGKGGVLSYEITGNGTIEANAEKYIDLYEGVRIQEVAVTKGHPVKEGDLLFTYDIRELTEVRENLEDELTVAELNQEKEMLSYEAGDTASEAQAASVSLQRAKQDLVMAGQELDAAKKKIEEEKEKQLDAAEEARSDAQREKTEKEEDRKDALKQAGKEVTQAEEALDELYEDKRMAEKVLADYKIAALNSAIKLIAPPADSDAGRDSSDIADELSFPDEDYYKMLNSINDSFYGMLDRALEGTRDTQTSAPADTISTAEKNIFIQYYGKDGYESHVEEVQKARQTLARAKEDYLLIFIGAAESGGGIATAQKAACIRTYQDAAEALDKLTRKDAELSKAILRYGAAVQSKAEPEITSTYSALFSLLYQEKEDKSKKIKEAQALIDSKQEELTRLTKEWNRNLERAEEEAASAEEAFDEAQEIFDRITDGTYDYTADAEAQESRMEAARRSVEDAQMNLTKAEEKDAKTLAANNTKQQRKQLDARLYELDSKKKKEAVAKIEELLDRDGQVYASVSGILLHNDLAVGSKTTGAEKVSISLENYEFYTKVTKDEVKRLEIGDEISIGFMNKGSRNIITEIESIGPVDAQGVAEITAILPEGEYTPGTPVTFSVSKKSEQYRQTIPMQAVRSDASGVNYVLVIGESNTVLGRELTAYRRNVTVLDKDFQTAAIEADLGREERIIVSSSKNIEEGDRVRVNEGNE